MQKLISILVAAMIAAVNFNAVAADNKVGTDPAKQKAKRKAAPQNGKSSDASAGSSGKASAKDVIPQKRGH